MPSGSTWRAKGCTWETNNPTIAQAAASRRGLAGIVSLTDKDRAPWLRAITSWMDDIEARGESGVITCSALRRRYRDDLLSGRPPPTMVFLEVSKENLVQRLSHRYGHFFPEKLLDSQLAAFEPPARTSTY